MAVRQCGIALGVLLVSQVASPARAEPLRALSALHEACREAESAGRRVLHSVEVRRVHFAPYNEDASLMAIDTHRRNVPILGGAAELVPSGRETIGFVASAERARSLRSVVAHGGIVRIGFFLGFDGDRRPCLVRPSFAVTSVRADLAFVEILDAQGEVVAREDTERLRAWLDDAERDGFGSGPRARVGVLSARDGDVPGLWERALHAPSLAAELGGCFAAARERDAGEDETVVLSLQIEGGTIREVGVSLASFRDRDALGCIRRAVGGLRVNLEEQRARSLTVPLHLRDD